jgi:hypothetical protein
LIKITGLLLFKIFSQVLPFVKSWCSAQSNREYSKLKFGNGVDNFNALPYYKEELATQESDGLLSANDKVKVDAMSTIFTSDVEPNAPIGSIWIDTSIGGLEIGEEVEY